MFIMSYHYLKEKLSFYGASVKPVESLKPKTPLNDQNKQKHKYLFSENRKEIIKDLESKFLQEQADLGNNLDVIA